MGVGELSEAHTFDFIMTALFSNDIRKKNTKQKHKRVCTYVALFISAYVLIFVLYCYDRRLFRHRDCYNKEFKWTETKKTPQYNIAIVTVSDDYIGRDHVKRSVKNKRQFAAHWNFEFITRNISQMQISLRDGGAKRAKFRFISTVINNYDAVFWIDIDAVFMKYETNINILLHKMILEDKYISLCPDASLDGMLNSGVIMLRSGTKTNHFLVEFENSHSIIRDCRALKTCPPGLYDQNIISFMTGTWPYCAFNLLLWPFSPLHKEWKYFNNMIYEAPACIFNAVPTEATRDSLIQHCYGGGIRDVLSEDSILGIKGKGYCVEQLLNTSHVVA